MNASDLSELITSVQQERPRRVRISSCTENYHSNAQITSKLIPSHLETVPQDLEQQNCLKAAGKNKLTDDYCFKMLSIDEPRYKIITEPAGPRKEVDYDKLINELRGLGLSEAEIFPERKPYDKKGRSRKKMDKLGNDEISDESADSSSKKKKSKKKDRSSIPNTNQIYRNESDIINHLSNLTKLNADANQKADKPRMKGFQIKGNCHSREVTRRTWSVSDINNTLNNDDQLNRNQFTDDIKGNKSVLSERLIKLAQPKHVREKVNDSSTKCWKVPVTPVLNSVSSLTLQQLTEPKALYDNRCKKGQPPFAEGVTRPKTVVPFLEYLNTKNHQ